MDAHIHEASDACPKNKCNYPRKTGFRYIQPFLPLPSCAQYSMRAGAKSASAFPVRSRQTAGFFKRVLLSFKKIKIDIVKEK